MSDSASLNKYEFDADFQSKIVYCMIRSTEFMNRASDSIKPEYFEQAHEAYLVNVVKKHYEKYDAIPSLPAIVEAIRQDKASGMIKQDLIDDVKPMLANVKNNDLVADTSDFGFVADCVNVFARHQAMEAAILKSVDLLARKEYDKAAKLIADASAVGTKSDISNYNFFGQEEIEKREQLRQERIAAMTSPRGDVITTGLSGLDSVLFWKGWAKKELYSLMGAPKSGKSISLAHFARCAAMSGKNVLFVTLEVSTAITSERIESGLIQIAMDELAARSAEAKDKIEELVATHKGLGKLQIEEFSSGTLTPRQLATVIEKHRVKGNEFDMVVVDYADIMAPNHRYDNPIENSKSIYVDLRALAQKENVAILTAMQTNRTGATSAVAKMEHAAEDFNKIRIPDLVISINATDEEKANGEARLYFAASRNQQGNITIHIKQDLETMTFIKSIIKIGSL